jgi:hypothetical protein
MDDSSPTLAINPSPAAKLIQVAALAAALVGFGSVRAEATSCLFTPFLGDAVISESCAITEGGFTEFDFAGEPYMFFLKFTGLSGTIDVTVTDVAVSQEDFDFRATSQGFLGRECVEFSPGICRDFTVTTDSKTRIWDSYALEITWTTPGTIANSLLHARGGGLVGETPNNLYNEDMCEIEGCVISTGSAAFGDPGISSDDTDFSVFDAAVNTTIPEPATVTLLATGVSAFWYRKRRSKRPVRG